MLGEPGLNGIEQDAVEQRRLRAGQDLTLECDFADIEAVPEHVEERALHERYPAAGGARREVANL